MQRKLFREYYPSRREKEKTHMKTRKSDQRLAYMLYTPRFKLTALTCALLVSPALSVSIAQPGSPDSEAKQILSAASKTGGLIVHIGCGNGELTAALGASDGYLVHGLDSDPEDVQRAREHIRSRGRPARISVDHWKGKRLPYIDNLVSLLVAEEPINLPKKEILRVLAPQGVAYIKTGDTWTKTVKPWPRDIDEWTHYLHGPDNNAVARDTVVGPPRHMQWVAGPLWARNHHKLCSISAVVTARGRIFYIMDEAPAANINLPGKWSLVARDAFSGVRLWQKPMASWTWHALRFRSGPPQVTRLLVASGDRLCAPLGLNAPVSVMDATTGETLKTYDATAGAEEIIMAGDILLVIKGSPVAEHATKHAAFAENFRFPSEKTIVALQAETGRMLWQWSDPQMHVMPETLASDGKRVYFQAGEGVVCLDLKSGDTLWVAGQPTENQSRRKVTYGKYTLVVTDGVVLCKLSEKLTALSAENGENLWECQAGGGFHSPLDVFVIDGLVWQGRHVSDSVAPKPVQDFSEGRDVHTGRIKTTNTIMVDLQTAGHHHRCYREKATERYIITGKRGVEMMDLSGDDHSRNNWVRGTCQYGILPANGLIYAPPHACGCYMESKLWGFWALAAESTDVRKLPQRERLEKGPAYGGQIKAETESGESWPQYRHDPLRSGVAGRRHGEAGTVVPTELQPAWSANLGGRLTPAVVAGGKVLLCAEDDNTVYALDESSGKVLWRYVVGGRVDSPPAIHRGMVLFGSADGRVYCLRLSDGELIWRFLAAPADLRTVAEDRVESLWPVHGSVLVLNGVAYCSAGRSTWLDHGIDLYGLDPSTGDVVCKTHYQSRHPKFREGKDKAKPEHVVKVSQNLTDYKTFLASDLSDSFSMAAGTRSDVLVSNGRDVFLHHVRFDAKLGKQDRMARHLFSTSSLLDDAENHRSHWVLGTGDFSRIPVAYSWIANRPGKRSPTIAVPTGVLMVYNDRAVWGVKRKGDALGRYWLFQKDNTPFSEKEKSLPDFRKIPRNQVDACVWKCDLPVRATAMVKSGDHLFLGAVPVDIPEDDPLAAYEGRKGAMLWIAAARDGSKVAEYELASPVVWDGIAAAHGRLYVTTENGRVLCLAGKR
jgi:outer membrane protein assembly factor BamB